MKKYKQSVRLFFTGFAMGMADIVPGVSGGTIALILGIYKDLIQNIKNLIEKTLKLGLKLQLADALKSVPFYFFIPLGLGILTAVMTVAGIITTLLDNHPIQIWSFFFGLVVASAFLVSRNVTRWGQKEYILFVVSAIITYFIVGAVPQQTPDTKIAFFLSGAIAICAMILPGISGSFILVLLGKYYQVLEAVTSRDFLTLGIFLLGAAVGISLFSKLLSWMIKTHNNILMATLTGLMVGSLRKIWPWKITFDEYTYQNILPTKFDEELLSAFILAFIGFILISILEDYQNEKGSKITKIKNKLSRAINK